jgi:hypothetical protein
MIASGVLARLRAEKEMLHRRLQNVEAIKHLIGILRTDLLLSLS